MDPNIATFFRIPLSVVRNTLQCALSAEARCIDPDRRTAGCSNSCRGKCTWVFKPEILPQGRRNHNLVLTEVTRQVNVLAGANAARGVCSASTFPLNLKKAVGLARGQLRDAPRRTARRRRLRSGLAGAFGGLSGVLKRQAARERNSNQGRFCIRKRPVRTIRGAFGPCVLAAGIS